MATNKGASQEAIQYHYDVGNDFYSAWLDSGLSYSAAIWPDDRSTPCTLEQAQDEKLDWHLASAGASDGMRLLDIGCGWGSLINHALAHRAIGGAVGLTLAEEQAALDRERFAGQPVEIQVRAWQEFAADQPFDAIISIGAFEHFAKPDMDPAEKTACYGEFFRFCAHNLVDGGRLSLQTITWMNMTRDQETANLPLHIFPESNLPRFAEIAAAAEPSFHTMKMHNRPRDYALTLREWMKRLRSNRGLLEEKYGKDLVNRYLQGFASFALGFDHGVLGLTRWSFLKRPG